jgi:hypothetical protein
MMTPFLGGGEDMVLRKLLTLVFLGAMVSVAHAQSYTANARLDLRISGMLLPADTPKRDDLALVDVTVQNQPMVLRIGQVEDITERDKSQVNKNDVLSHQVRFTGAAELMEQLLRPETVGKVVTIEGWLNANTRIFQVTVVTVKESAAKQPSK